MHNSSFTQKKETQVIASLYILNLELWLICKSDTSIVNLIRLPNCREEYLKY